MHIKELIVEGYKEAEQKFFSQGIDPNQVKIAIQTFKSLVDRNQVQGQERNIDWWAKNKKWVEFQNFVNVRSQKVSQTQLKRKKIAGQSINIYEDEQSLVVIPLDKAASCFHGKESDWCTTKPHQSHFENYFYKHNITLIYVIKKKTGEKFVIAFHTDLPENTEFFDINDSSITAEEFHLQSGLDPYMLIDKANVVQHKERISSSRTDYKKVKKEVLDFIGYHRSLIRNEHIENQLMKLQDYDLFVDYIKGVLRSPVFQQIPEVIQNVIFQKENLNLNHCLAFFHSGLIPTPKIEKLLHDTGRISWFDFAYEGIYPDPNIWVLSPSQSAHAIEVVEQRINAYKRAVDDHIVRYNSIKDEYIEIKKEIQHTLQDRREFKNKNPEIYNIFQDFISNQRTRLFKKKQEMEGYKSGAEKFNHIATTLISRLPKD